MLCFPTIVGSLQTKPFIKLHLILARWLFTPNTKLIFKYEFSLISNYLLKDQSDFLKDFLEVLVTFPVNFILIM